MNDRHVDPSWPVAEGWPPPPSPSPARDEDIPVRWDVPEDAQDAASSTASETEDVRSPDPVAASQGPGGGVEKAPRRNADHERAVPFWIASSSDVTVSWDVPEEADQGTSSEKDAAADDAGDEARSKEAPSSSKTAEDRGARPGSGRPRRRAVATAEPAGPGRMPSSRGESPPTGSDRAGPASGAGPVRRRRSSRGAAAAEGSLPGEGAAREICLRLLAAAPRTRAQLADALRRKGVPEDTVERVLGRLSEIGLIDDEAFARAWVHSRHVGRGLARRALAGELRRRGVADETINEAVQTLDPEQEERTARELVARRLPGTRTLPPDKRMRRLVGMLARKGYPPGLCYRVVKEALEAEGGGLDDLDDHAPVDFDD